MASERRLRRFFVEASTIIGSAILIVTTQSGCRRSTQSAREAGSPTNSPSRATANQAPSSSGQPQEVAVKGGLVLKAKWAHGSSYVYRIEMVQHSTNQFAQKPDPTREDLTMGTTYSLSPHNNTTNGGCQLELELLACDLAVKLGDHTVLSYDSTETAAKAEYNPIVEPFRRLVGSRVNLQLDSTGRVEKVLGLDAWVQSMVRGASGPGEKMLVQQFNEGFFRQTADYARAFPDKPVQVGESWPYRVEVPAGGIGKIIVDSTITFKRWEDHEQKKFAVLETAGALSSRALPQPGATATMSIEQGTVKGTSWFDPEFGALIESAVEQSMRLSGVIPPTPGGHPTPVAFTSDVEQIVTVKLVEANREQE
jgi:hypothetical protein